LGCGGEGVRDARTGLPVPERSGIGVSFDCPCGCGRRCAVPFANPLDGQPAPEGYSGGRGWNRTGDTFEALTLSPSIQRVEPDGCRWHGWIRDGEVVSC
jgi:hypothetical protein